MVETIFSEYVAYFPLAALLLALVGVWAGRQRRSAVAFCLLAVMGLFFALGAANPVYILLVRLVPGFALFRAPARWLALYAFAGAMLAGLGLDALRIRRSLPRRQILITWGVAMLLIIGWSLVAPRVDLSAAPPEAPVVTPSGITIAGWIIELGLAAVFLVGVPISRIGYLGTVSLALFLTSRALPYNHPTAPEAFHALRPAPAYLLAAGSVSAEGGTANAAPPGRFLSISDIFFDPGDMGELASIYEDQLEETAFYDLIIASKQKEILAPNIPLALGIPAVDGYDGGLLPLANYVALQELLLPAEDVSIDGRLRENLESIPEGRWLDLFNVRYVVTDKVGDAWSEGVFFDLEHSAVLDESNPSAQIAYLPSFEATGLRIVLERPALPDGTALAVVTVDMGGRKVLNHTLIAGADMFPLRPESDGNYLDVTKWDWPAPGTPVKISLTGGLEPVVLRGISLVDERDGAFQSLVLSNQGRYRLVHSGDVKIYENLTPLPRAFFVGRATWAADNSGVLATMMTSEYDPADQVLLLGEESGSDFESLSADGEVTIIAYEPERIELLIKAGGDGWLVLSDAYYPGWEARVDGETSPVERADLLFRAVHVNAGSHEVILTYQPASVTIGLIVSGVAFILCVLTLCLRGRKRRASPRWH